VTFSLYDNEGSTINAKYTRQDKKIVKMTITHATGKFSIVKSIIRKYLSDHIREVIFEY